MKTYTSEQIREAERPLLAAGVPLMQHAAAALATECARLLRGEKARGEGRLGRAGVYGSRVLVLVGAGNNGGDALYAGERLARRGASVRLAVLGERVHEAGLAAALAAGARRAPGGADRDAVLAEAARADLIIDGILGIGARGGLREPLAGVVAALAAQLATAGPRAPLVVAVDTPSGIEVDTGGVEGPVLLADVTVTMGAAKTGLLAEPARAYVGRLVVVPLGYELPEADACELDARDLAALIPVPGPHDSKYTRGVLGVHAGTANYPGAGIMCTAAALASGPGMVRYLGDEAVGREIVRAHPEVVTVAGRVQAHVVGPGGSAAEDTVCSILEANLPAVVDAEAILTAINLANGRLPEHVVLTPHAGEAEQLAAAIGLTRNEAPWTRADIEAHQLEAARALSEAIGATVLLKGAVDVAAGPDGTTYLQGGAPNWRGTAGAGDVLAGITGALLATRTDVAGESGGPARIAAAAAAIHGRAAALASGVPFGQPTRGGHPIGAADIAAHLSEAIATILDGSIEGESDE